MDRNFARALPLVLKHEGGWADHPKDPGGATMKGVTLATFRRYVKSNATKADLRAISDEQISTVYYRHYWSAVNAQALPAGVDYAVFDFAVNSGPSRAAKFLQQIVGVKQDGRIGPATIAAVKKYDPSKLITNLCTNRLNWLKRLKTWNTFGKGWSRRVDDVQRHALSFVGNPADVERIPVPVDKPTVPEKVDGEVKKKTGFWSWLTGAGGALGSVSAFFAGLDWQTVVAIGGVALLVLIIVLLLRRQIIGAVKDIRAEIET